MKWELCDLKERPLQALEFPSKRGLQMYRNLREAVAMIYGSYSFASAKKLVAELGPYQLEEHLASKLRRGGFLIDKDGELSFLSMKNFLDESNLEKAAAIGYEVADIRFQLESLPNLPKKLYLASQSLPVLNSFFRVQSEKLDLWQQLECIDTLECHRNPSLIFS